MTDTVTPSTSADTGEMSGNAARASIELNGAVVLRPNATPPRRRQTHRAHSTAAPLRVRLEELHSAIVAELQRRRDAAGLEPADSLPVPVKELSSITGELPRLARRAPAVLRQAAGAARQIDVPAVVRDALGFLAKQRELTRRQEQGVDVVDDFGFDQEWTEALLPLFNWLYRSYWRVQVRGLEHVPARGRALLVSNHAGVMPYDGAMIRTAIFEDHPAHRHARALILSAFFGMPLFSWFLRRTGNTLAHPLDAERLLERDELVLVFPEGAKGTGKPWSQRYRLDRFGRGGFASIAIRTRSPIVPISVVGSEEVHPMLANVRPLANALGLPFVPVTPTLPLLGPLGLVPLPSSWIIEFHAPVLTGNRDVRAADEAAQVMELSDQVRDTIQAGLFANLERRGSVFA